MHLGPRHRGRPGPGMTRLQAAHAAVAAAQLKVQTASADLVTVVRAEIAGGRTLQSIADELGVSKGRVGQLARSAASTGSEQS